MSTSTGQKTDSSDDYGYSVVLARTFDEVLDRAEQDARSIDVRAFAQAVRRTACTLLQARGGAGKSYTAERVGAVLAEQGLWTATVPAVALATGADLDTWAPGQWAGTSGDRALSDLADAGVPGLIVVDGLNEVDRQTGERILEAIGPATAADPQVTFLVTDRLTRRDGASPHWRYATLSRVPDDVIRRVAETEPTEALGIPFYLERHAAGSAAGEILKESVTRFVPEAQLAPLAEAAFLSYARRGRREIDQCLVVEAIGEGAWQEMLDAREVVASGAEGSGAFQFVHHLLHDFLAGMHVAAHRSLWRPEAFDVVTLGASSYDAMALALSQLPPGEPMDTLVLRVYDWNFYAAAYMLEEDRSAGPGVDPAVSLALLGALAEKRFDEVVPTVVRAEDALRVQQSDVSALLLAARTRDEVVGVLRNLRPHRTPAWFDAWTSLFERPDGSPADAEDVTMLTADDPVLGWAAANALRRLDLGTELTEGLRSLLRSDATTVRWRAAHALGTHASEENLAALRATLAEEPDRSWVAYGALRSVFEQMRELPAGERRYTAAEVATELAPRVVEDGPLRAETVRCLDVSPLPADWHRDVEPLLEVLWDTADARGAAELAALAERLRRRKEAERAA